MPLARPKFRSVLLAAVASIAGAASAQSEKPTGSPGRGETKESQRAAERARAKNFVKLDREDKAATDAVVGFAAPGFPAAAERLDLSAPAMSDLRGKVVVVQTFTSRNAAGFAALETARRAAEATKLGDEIVVLGVHTPEGADKAKAQIEKTLGKSGIKVPILIDADGTFCDALGAFRKPLAFLVDRQGNVRYAGLSDDGIEQFAKELAAEPFDAAVAANARPDPAAAAGSVAFPEFKEAVQSAADLRGKRAPQLFAKDWWNAPPSTQGKLVVVDFWATWCGPCRAAIPHMNEIARGYANDVACVGITDESQRNFDEGCLKHRIKKSDFAYAIGLDPSAAMKSAFQVRGIPHVAVISADGIVRWQGHPMSLSPNVMDQLVRANRALVSKSSSGPTGSSGRWSRDRR